MAIHVIKSVAVVALGILVLAAAAGCRSQAIADRGDRQVTVLLIEYKGPDAGPSAQRLAKELTDQGLPDVFVVQGADLASVCAGHFDSWQDKRSGELLRRVRGIRDTAGQFPFAGVLLVPVPEPMPENSWPLEKAPGLYSLHIASWEAPGRMPKAQAYAATLRAQGYEAYVYHGPRLSMVTLGGYGPEIFDIPGLAGVPGARPKIIDPKVLDLIQKFPRMRLEGEVTPPEAYIPTQLVRIPGRDLLPAPLIVRPKVLYRVTLNLIDTQTGLVEGRRRSEGVAQSKDEVATLVSVLARQLLASLPAGQPVRIGIAGIEATDAESAQKKIDAAVVAALLEGLGRAPDKAVVVDEASTRLTLDASGLKPADVLRDTRAARGVSGLHFIVTGTVTAFPREGR